MNRRWTMIGSLAFAAGLPLAVYWFKNPRVAQTSDKKWIYWVASPGLFSSSKVPTLNVVNVGSSPRYVFVRVAVRDANSNTVQILGPVTTQPTPVEPGFTGLRSSELINPRQAIKISLPAGTGIRQVTVESFKDARG